MISSLSTYIQFLSAIYVTICLDNMIGRRFWSPNYYDLVTGELSIFKRSISTPKQAVLEKKIKEKAVLLDDRSRKRGSLMLFYFVLIMFYNSFESDYYTSLPVGAELLSYYLPFCVLLSTSLILPLLYDQIFRRWRCLLLIICLQATIFVFFLIGKSSFRVPDWLCFIAYTKWAIAILLPIPIVYQLYINWLYSKAYLCHLKWEVRDEYEKYQKSKTAYEQKNKNMADPSYYQAFSNILLDANPDNMLTELNKTLYEHLEDRCTPPSPWYLFLSWNKKKDKELPEIEQPSIPDEENLPVEKEIGRTLDRSKYEQYFEEYEKTPTKPKLSRFCSDKGLNYNDFHAFYTNKKKRKVSLWAFSISSSTKNE